MPPRTSDRTQISVFSRWRESDDLAAVASILREHDSGHFFRSANLVNEMMTDSWIQGTTQTRIGKLLSAPFKINPASDKRKARKVAEELGGTDGYSGTWEQIVPPSAISAFLKWGIYLGFAFGRIEWQRTPEAFTPRLVPWNPANVWWDNWRKVFMVNTLEGPVVLPRPDQQPEGDGEWVVWCPYGVQDGWLEGLVRSLGDVYISRQYAKLDFNRWTESRSKGVIKGKVPQGATDEVKDRYRADLGNINSDGVVICPQGSKDEPGFDVEGVQLDGGSGTSWQGISALLEKCNTEISVLLLGGNLGTDTKGGSLAAAKDQRQNIDDRGLRDATVAGTFSRMLLTHWAEANEGDRGLAPVPFYEVKPPEDELGEAQALKALGEAIQALTLASPRVDAEAILEGEGVPMISDEELAALQEEEAQAAADAAAQAQQQAAPGAGGDQPPADPAKQRTALSGSLESVRKRCSFQGLEIAIENPAGTIRQWRDAAGAGHTVMKFDYGFIEAMTESDGRRCGILGADKEELDCYLGPDEMAPEVYVIHQRGMMPSGRMGYDEDKCMLGFSSAEEAKAAFLAHRNDGDRAYGGMNVMPLEQFKAKLRRRGTATTKLASTHDTARSILALVGRAQKSTALAKTVAGNKRAAKYQDKLVEQGVKRAAAALAPFLRDCKAEVDKISSPAELRPLLIKKLRASNPKGLVKALQLTGVLGNVSGQAGARQEVGHAH